MTDTAFRRPITEAISLPRFPFSVGNPALRTKDRIESSTLEVTSNVSSPLAVSLELQHRLAGLNKKFGKFTAFSDEDGENILWLSGGDSIQTILNNEDGIVVLSEINGVIDINQYELDISEEFISTFKARLVKLIR